MGTTVDSLDIQISAQSAKASQSLDVLIRKLDKVTSSLTRVGGSGMAQMNGGISVLAANIKKVDPNNATALARLANSLSKLSSVNSGGIKNSSSAIKELGVQLSSLSKIRVDENTKQITQLVNGISRLGGKSATQAVQNIPLLGDAMMKLMDTLSRAPLVNKNLIAMTDALARLAKTGSTGGRMINSLSGSLSNFSLSSIRASKHSTSLASKIGKLYASYWLLFRLFNKLGDSIELSSSLTEVQNVIAGTFGEYSYLVEEMASKSVQELGMSELTVKQVASRFQAMGSSMGVARGQMANMSLDLTRLTADMASFYNMNQSDVAKDLESIFTGETRPLRTYGLDLTQATLKEYALREGLNANISAMSQAEKAMLRYKYVMDNTSAAQGDFARTSNTWANQTRILKQNFEALGSVIGGVLINTFKPLVSWLNKIMASVISAVETIANALGAIFGWTIEIFPSGSADVMEDLSDYGNDAAGGLGNAADKANELKKALMGFDVIEKLPDANDSSGGSGGGGSGAGAGGGSNAALVRVDSVLEKYKSSIDSLGELGDYIQSRLVRAMERIDWGQVYGKAMNFGKGLAEFLNGLLTPQLFEGLGETLSSSLNTAFYSLYSFGDEFDWPKLGVSIATGVNKYFSNFKWGLAGDTFNTFINGILDSMLEAMKRTNWEVIGRGIGEFFSKIDWKNVFSTLGQIVWEAIKGAIGAFSASFDAAPLETTILTAIALLKFNGLEMSIGKTIWSLIHSALTGSSAKTAAGKAASGLGTTLATAIKNALSNSTFLTGVSASLNTLWPSLVSGAGDLFSAMGGIGNPFGVLSIPEARETMLNNIKDFFNPDSWKAETNEYVQGQKKLAELRLELDMTPLERTIKNLDKKGIPVSVVANVTKKLFEKPLEKAAKALQLAVGIKPKTSSEKIQDYLNDIKNVALGADVKLNTKPTAIQRLLAAMSGGNGFSIDAAVKTKTTKEELMNDIASKYFGFYVDVTGKIVELENSVPDKQKKLGVTAKYTSASDKRQKPDKILETIARYTSTQNGLASKDKKIGGITAVVTALTKNANLSLALTAAFSVISNGLKLLFKEDGGLYRNGSWSPITAYAGGGLPSMGQMFVAREAGPELVGTLGGHTAVMNNDQIVASVSAGVYQAVRSAMSQFSGRSDSTPMVQVYVGGKQVTDVVVEQVNQQTMATGVCPILV